MAINNFLITSICIFSLFLGCRSLDQNKQNFNQTDLNGKWVIQEIDQITDPSLITPSSTHNLLDFFGAEIWLMAEGKYFEFKENGALETNIHINDPSSNPELSEWAELSKKVYFGYNFNSNLTILIYSEKELIYESQVKVISFDSNQIIWEIGELLKVTLIKVE